MENPFTSIGRVYVYHLNSSQHGGKYLKWEKEAQQMTFPEVGNDIAFTPKCTCTIRAPYREIKLFAESRLFSTFYFFKHVRSFLGARHGSMTYRHEMWSESNAQGHVSVVYFMWPPSLSCSFLWCYTVERFRRKTIVVATHPGTDSLP